MRGSNNTILTSDHNVNDEMLKLIIVALILAAGLGVDAGTVNTLGSLSPEITGKDVTAPETSSWFGTAIAVTDTDLLVGTPGRGK